MTFTKRTFDIDLRDSPQTLAVELDAAPLERLLADAGCAYRLYELALLERPGDLWEYLEVVPLHLSPPLAARLDLARMKARDAGDRWPDGRFPFDVFDREVRAEQGEASEAWSEACGGEDARGFLQRLFEHLPRRDTQAGGYLASHERARIAAGTHPFSHLTRERAIAASRLHPPNSPAHTEAFYAKLSELIAGADVGSVSVRGLGDHRLLRLLCERQRTRDDFEISATTEREVNNVAWDARVAYYDEGVGQGFLFVQDGASSRRSVKDLVETYTTLGPGGLLLSSEDEGEITGFARESGDGWYLYRSEVTPHMLPSLRRYHNVLALMLAQENGELSDTQVVEIIAQWENFVARRPTSRDGD
jgi:hypothetical protein